MNKQITVKQHDDGELYVHGFTGNPVAIATVLGILGLVSKILVASGCVSALENWATTKGNDLEKFLAGLIGKAIQDAESMAG